MAINFIPNDPDCINLLPMVNVTPRKDRSGGQAKLDIKGAVAQELFAVGTPEFLYWQCREAALAAIEAWENISDPLTSWGDSETMPVFPDDGEDLNAYYDHARDGRPKRVSFFHKAVGTKTYFSGASTDVVAHEFGHALLDTIRPDFWTSFRFEVNSFHEAFGDCIALVTALHNQDSRTLILPTIAKRNAVESTAEDLAAAIKGAVPGHNAGVARRARNDFLWGPVGSLPTDGGPGELIYEEHSFGQVFSGCFYDTIVNILGGMNANEANLLKATRTAGQLLVQAVKQAPQRAQYFREVGRLMILVDEQENNAANRDAIRDAFKRHGLALGSSLTLAPQAAIAMAPTPERARKGAVRGADAIPKLAAAAKRELLSLIGADKGKLAINAVIVAGQALLEAVYQRLVPLDGLHKKLKGVVAGAAQVALLGHTHNAISIMGHVSNGEATVRDVEAMVESLVKHDRITFAPKAAAAKASKKSLAASIPTASPNGVTHEVVEIRGQKTLVRTRFACFEG